jgi:hypothetical protein
MAVIGHTRVDEAIISVLQIKQTFANVSTFFLHIKVVAMQSW